MLLWCKAATDPLPPDTVTIGERPFSFKADVRDGVEKSKFNQSLQSVECVHHTHCGRSAVLAWNANLRPKTDINDR